MPDFFNLTGPSRPPANGGAARRLVILLHGYGADGNDLIGLAPHLARVLPDAAFVSPDAPFPCEMAPLGRQWFGLTDRQPVTMLAGTRMAAPILESFIDDQLAAHGLTEDALALVGFSQGTMMALHVALRRARPCAAVVGYSGRLVGAEALAEEVVARPPVLLIHGDADPMVPVQSLADAVAGLNAAGVAVESHIRPGLGHGIDGDGLELGARFLAKALAPEGSATTEETMGDTDGR